jgi:Glycosyl hydrolases family 38 N-terminal domain
VKLFCRSSPGLQYANAHAWYKNLDKLIHYANLDGRLNVFYSTPAIYLDAKHGTADVSWPLKTDDFFPYADCPHCYWTGEWLRKPAGLRQGAARAERPNHTGMGFRLGQGAGFSLRERTGFSLRPLAPPVATGCRLGSRGVSAGQWRLRIVRRAAQRGRPAPRAPRQGQIYLPFLCA